MIYFLQQAKNLLIKIGYTASDTPDGRVKAGQTWNPDGLTLLLTMPGGLDTEKALHGQFQATHVAGEWFKPAPELLHFITSQAALAGSARRLEAVRDPWKVWPLRFYLAGKMDAEGSNKHNQPCWRASILNAQLYSYSDIINFGECLESDTRPRIRKSVVLGHDYTGPYYFDESGGHGTFTDDTHGNQFCGDPDEDYELVPSYRSAIVPFCRAAIANCDILFAWISSLDCFGTLAEIGLASAMGRRVWIASPKRFRDLWFVYRLSEDCDKIIHETPLAALKYYLDVEAAARRDGSRLVEGRATPCP